MQRIVNEGAIFETKQSGDIEILKRINRTRYLVKFLETGHIKEADVSNITRRAVKDPYSKTIKGFGCWGRHYDNRKNLDNLRNIYLLYNNMLGRVMKDKFYQDCSVDERWSDFSNFYDDVQKLENYEEWASGKGYELDKDCMENGNRKYSPEKCMFVPSCINKFEAIDRQRRK